MNHPAEKTDVYVALGSNDQPEENLRRALDLLCQRATVRAVSAVVQSPDYSAQNQPDYLNAVVWLTTADDPARFRTETLASIEAACGRVRLAGARVALDIDILLWGDGAFTYGEKPWHVPHASILQHAAIAIPLAQLAPDRLHPLEKVSLAQIVARLPQAERDAVRRHPLALACG